MKRIKCYIYTRVSTSMQVDGYSLDAQKEKLRKYAAYQDMIVAGEYCDEGKSGKSIEGRRGRRVLRAGVQALALRAQRRRRADLPAADAGFRGKPHLRGGRHRLLQGQRQTDDLRALRRRRDRARKHPRPDHGGPPAEGPRRQVERRLCPLRLQARGRTAANRRGRSPGDPHHL